MSLFTIIVDETGPDWEPTKETKYYAQISAGSFSAWPVPVNINDYAFGPTPAAAVHNLAIILGATS